MNMLAKYGAESKYGINDPQAIVGVVMKIFTIVINIVVGIAAGAQPVIGYNYGAKLYKRVKKGYLIILVSTIVVSAIATIFFQTIPRQIASIFGSNTSSPENYFEFGEKTVRIYLMLILFTCVEKLPLSSYSPSPLLLRHPFSLLQEMSSALSLSQSLFLLQWESMVSYGPLLYRMLSVSS